MKAKFLFTILMLFILVGCTSQQSDQLTQQQKEQIKSEVKAVSDSITARWVGLDAEGALQYYSPDLVHVYDSLRLDFQAYKKGWIDLNNSITTIKVTPIREDYIVLTKDLVISTWVGKDEYNMKSGDKIIGDPLTYTLVFKNIAGQWKVLYSHASVIPVTQKAEKK